MRRQRKIRTVEDRNRFVGTALILFVLLIIFGGVLCWMYSVKLLTIPNSLLELFGMNNSEDGSGTLDTGELSWMIKDNKTVAGKEIVYELNYENLRAAILSEQQTDGFKQEVSVTYVDGNATYSTLYKSGKNARIEIYELTDEGEKLRTELVIYDSNTVYHLDCKTGKSRSVVRSEDVSPENAAKMPSVDELLYIIEEISKNETAEVTTSAEIETTDEYTPEQLSDGENIDYANTFSRWRDLNIFMKSTEIGNVYQVSFYDDYLGTFEEYYLSLEYNTVLYQAVFYGDERIYLCETLSFSTEKDDWSDTLLYTP